MAGNALADQARLVVVVLVEERAEVEEEVDMGNVVVAQPVEAVEEEEEEPVMIPGHGGLPAVDFLPHDQSIAKIPLFKTLERRLHSKRLTD